MKYAKLADAGKIYDKAFEGWRSEFLKANFGYILAGIAVLIGIVMSAVRLIRRRRKEADGK